MTSDATPSNLDGQSVLILEDQVLIALDIEDMVLDLGAGVCWVVSGAVTALTLLETKRPDLALLDFNLGGRETSEGVADRLMDLHVPFVFLTGYGDGLVVPGRFGGIPIASKPVTKATLLTKIALAQDRFRSERMV
ncbi:response regulator [Acidisoma cellulosilytica]|uniref:Response regulator n=1 Tax=Acidisoma cellulosilyticum TaxID=2802395 RepID=A0A963Z4C8_9PROT|nr:response regulator [Acidisoma cellulosilyticum]MCB8882306.1 response regulator [Acidisoma cellulosilyticum]